MLDVFSISDDLAGAVIDSVTGRHVGYGSVTFLVQGPIGDYVALLDGIPVESSLDSLNRLVTGTHRLSVSKKDAKGRPPLIDQTFEVAEGQNMRVDVIIPTESVEMKDQNWLSYDERKNRGATTCTIADAVEGVEGTERRAHAVNGRIVKYYGAAGVVMKPGEKELGRLKLANGIILRIRGDAQPYAIRIETSNVTDGNYYWKWICPGKKDETHKIYFREFAQSDWGQTKSFWPDAITGISIEPVNRPSPWAPAPVSFSFMVSDIEYF